ncbi:MAG TPA: DUF3311 domain-containing protein [Terriglobales bacterium]|jgi:hypothetical protein
MNILTQANGGLEWVTRPPCNNGSLSSIGRYSFGRPDKSFRMKRPSFPAMFLGLIPFLAICFSVSAWDRVYPMVLGLPFNLFWLLSWTVLTPICMFGAYCVETARDAKSTSIHDEERQR